MKSFINALRIVREPFLSRVIRRGSYNARAAFLLIAILASSSVTAFGQTTAFTYQGKLADSGTPANGNYDFEFKLFDTAAVGTGTQQGSTVQRLNVSVGNGIFTVSLDFGACASYFNGAGRFLEISVKPTSGGAFTTLGPRQLITSTPYALKSVNATTSDGLSVTCVSCVTNSQIGSVSGSAVSGTIPVASVPAGSGNYVQINPSSQQASSNFNISGNGTAGGTLSATVVNATTRYDMNGIQVLSITGINNLFAGAQAGAAITSGLNNSFVGTAAGNSNNTGSSNSFFGRLAGQSNTTGGGNSFFGSSAGNTNQAGSNNTIIGTGANVEANNLTNATAIGARAKVDQSNSLVLGGITGVNSGTSVNVGIGTTAPRTRLEVLSNEAQIRFGDNTTDSGGYLVSTISSQAVIAGGAKWNGSAFVAKSSDSSAMNMFSGDIRFFNNTGLTVGTTFSPTERMVIASNGEVGIGVTNPSGKLHVAGDIRVGTGTTGCVVDADGTVLAGVCSSDVG